VATPKGLVVPVLRSVDKLSFAEVEKVRGRVYSLSSKWTQFKHTCHSDGMLQARVALRGEAELTTVVCVLSGVVQG
jgi:hypothetical protein